MKGTTSEQTLSDPVAGRRANCRGRDFLFSSGIFPIGYNFPDPLLIAASFTHLEFSYRTIPLRRIRFACRLIASAKFGRNFRYENKADERELFIRLVIYTFEVFCYCIRISAFDDFDAMESTNFLASDRGILAAISAGSFFVISFAFALSIPQEFCNIFPSKKQKRGFESNICLKKSKRYLEFGREMLYTDAENRNCLGMFSERKKH